MGFRPPTRRHRGGSHRLPLLRANPALETALPHRLWRQPSLVSEITSSSLPLLSSTARHSSLLQPIGIGGWAPIKDVEDSHVRELGDFAVEEHNRREHDELTFDKVVRGETQVVAGINYRLVLRARDAGGSAADYQAMVWEKVWINFRQLTSFVHIESYEDMDIALHYGAMLRECIRHQSVARFFLVFNEKEFGLSFDNISVAAIIYFYIIVQDYDIDSVRKSFCHLHVDW
ncbi:hypothetical protein ZIOFF_007138 [Zingiber officinale]|uniref:Cystatin domain-containing protein n=1 Tax=Zingiber officinale TaxID=94328 RepID=A0A8J5HQJ7_ZINOF|nr:hypothetical protein ZIOFF_007138 [Zingiber officinale]